MPFQMEAFCSHLELRPKEWTFLWLPSVPGERSWPEPSNHSLSGFTLGTVVAAVGPPVPIGRSGGKQTASTWNSDRGNGRFCGHPPFQVACHGFGLFPSDHLQVAWRKWIASANSRNGNANHNVRSSALTETGPAVCVCCRHLLLLRHPEPDMTLAETGGHIQYKFILDERKEETCDVRYGWCPVRHYAATRPSLEYCVQ